ncbi:hypothetical protein DPMN_104945 [Dreissena polymorpha]|uniref:Uncharacterized protein n=1 Tax=Dreissena polymorpha TaxID=45954 RepID=A0A9D4HCF5_DREPO|nr:hypothetical protein DPMN_104945 [Dreissena polymorpha]
MIRVDRSQISVIGPWCYSERPREFRHVQDLFRHVKGQHPYIYNDLPPKSLSTMNSSMSGIPLSTSPSTPNISPYDEARAARDAVVRWASGRTPVASQ